VTGNGNSKGKGSGRLRMVSCEEGGIWVEVTSSVGMPRLEVRAIG
jgi:hypothetical protein